MRYTFILLALILIGTIAVPGASFADKEEGCEGLTEPCVEPCDEPCDTPCDEPCDIEMEGQYGEECEIMVMEWEHCDDDMMRMDREHHDGDMMRREPWEDFWYERPWDMWRHLDEGSLNMDAVHYMAGVRTIAILPFADLTYPTTEGEPKLDDAGGARRLVENLAAELMSRGYLVIPPTDVAAVASNYFMNEVQQAPVADEAYSNAFWFRVLPERATEFYLRSVEGLQGHYDAMEGQATLFAPADIAAMAEILGADAVIRGFVNEYAVSDDIDADWRTFIPPFLGLINPDNRVAINVAYHIYDGPSGEMVWNGTADIIRDSNWQLFYSETEMLRNTENEAALWMTDQVLPNWMDIVMAHPGWVPFEMWYEFDERGCDRGYYPDWVNPYRQGWHDWYNRSEWRDPDFVEHPYEHSLYGEVSKSYDSMNEYRDYYNY